MNTDERGIVYLAGAGPGDPGLITLRAHQLLQACDVVVYDSLIPDELIVTLPPTVERHYVGKRGGCASIGQNEINKLLVKLARAGKIVVRLKGSDPLIFGRGGEEAEFLAENKIRFEIVPGVTAGVGATAYAGIPTTDRRCASWVLFATGHMAKDKQVSSVPWDWIAGGTKGTIVIYMGVAEVEPIVAELMTSGLSDSVPAAVIERGTFPSQRVFVSTLAELVTTVRANKVTAPALLVIGEAVKLRENLNWFRDKSLFGLRVMVTRPAHQADWVYRQLRELGAEVLAFPTIAVKEHTDEKAWTNFKNIQTEKSWLVFTSENGVEFFFSQFRVHGYDIRKLGAFKIAVIGTGTKRALKKYGITPDFIPAVATTAAFSEELEKIETLRGATVVRVRGNLSVDNIDQAIISVGAELIPMTVYETHHVGWAEERKAKLAEFPPDVVIFTSGSTADGLMKCLDPDKIKDIIAPAAIVSIGPATSKVIRSHGFDITLEATKHSIPDLIDQLVVFASSHSLRRSK
ncbi:MAG: uroporphyrinogen-III C-methyltransferase [candidate division Zixibacteria bacterium]|nr:uroporphyrinogen-III C-methyltransferase [candidate division Zixibacteria bacterium]